MSEAAAYARYMGYDEPEQPEQETDELADYADAVAESDDAPDLERSRFDRAGEDDDPARFGN